MMLGTVKGTDTKRVGEMRTALVPRQQAGLAGPLRSQARCEAGKGQSTASSSLDR